MEYTFEDILTNNFLSEECQVIYIFCIADCYNKIEGPTFDMVYKYM